MGGQRGSGAGLFHGGLQCAAEQRDGGALLHHGLAAQQVQCLDAVRALVDHVQAVVAPELLHGVLARVAVAAVDLDGQAVGLQAPLRGPGFDNGRKQVQQQARLGARGLAGAGALLVHQARGVQAQRKRALHIGLLRQQHAAHVGVRHQRHLRLQRVLGSGRAALQALARVLQRGQIAAVAVHHRAHAHADARLVHHVEHARQALVRPAHEFTLAVVLVTKRQHGGRGATPAGLVDQARQRHVVAWPQAAIGVDAELGHGEQRNALDPGRRARDARQHQVHDVLAQLVVAARDEDLAALDAVGAIGLRRGAGGQVRQAGAGLRLGQRHGAEETARKQRRQVFGLLRLAAEALDHIGIAQRQAHVRGGGAVGALEQRRAGLCHHHGKLHAALLVILGGRQQAGGAEGVERLAHLGNHAHAAVLEGRLVLVRGAVVRRKFFFSDGVRRVQRGGEGLAAVVGMARALRQRLGLQHFEQLEVEVAAVDEQGFGQGASGVLHCRI